MLCRGLLICRRGLDLGPCKIYGISSSSIGSLQIPLSGLIENIDYCGNHSYCYG